MTRARPRYLYRVVKSEQPDETAFSSPARQGRRLQPPITPEVLGAWRSVSFWDTPEAAEELARAYPKLGQWIATVELPPEIAPVPYGRLDTGTLRPTRPTCCERWYGSYPFGRVTVR